MKVSHTNETQNFQHVGGVTIPPGETRDVDASLLPGYEPEGGATEGGAPDAAPLDPLAKLLAGAVKNVLPALASLSDDDLARALVLEQEGQGRKSMTEALTVETLRRVAQPDADQPDQGQRAAAPLDQAQADPAATGA